MRNGRLRRRRSRAQPAIRIALAAVVFVGSGAAAGLAGYLASATDAGTRTTLADARDTPLAFQVSSTGGDAEQIDAALADQLARLDVPFEVYRSQIAGGRVVFPGPDGPPPDDNGSSDETDDESGLGHLVLAAYRDMAHHADLVAGEWPGSPSGGESYPVAIHAGPAAELGIAVGDVISFADRCQAVVLEVVGLWTPRAADSPFWFDEREADGSGGSTDLVGVMIDKGLQAVPGLTLTSRWRLVPDVDQLQARDLATLQGALPRLLPRLQRDDRTSGAKLEADSGILDVLRDSEDKRRAAQAVTAAPLMLFALAGVLAVALIGRLLVVARRVETSVYLARGVSVIRVLLWSIAETLPIVIVPSIAGAGAAWLVLYALPDTTVEPASLATAAGVASALAIVTLAAVGTRPALVNATVPHRSHEGRGTRVVLAITAVLAGVATVVTMWQLLRYGGPAVEDARGAAGVDPVAAIAPVAALATSGLLVTAGVALGARAGQRLVARRRTLGSVLALRSVARRPAAYAMPITLVVLAIGSGTLAAGLSGTWSELQRDAAAQRTGADMQVVLASRPRTAATPPDGAALEPYRRLTGTTGVTPVLAGWVPLSGDQVQFAAVADEPPRFAGAELAADADSVELVFTAAMTAREIDYGEDLADERPAEPTPGQVGVRLLLSDADGMVNVVRTHGLEVPDGPAPGRHVVRAELPAGTGPWTLAGIELSVGGQRSRGPVWWANDYRVTLAQINSISGDSTQEIRRPPTWSFGFAGEAPRVPGDEFAVEQTDAGPGFEVTSGGGIYPSFDLRLLAGEWSIGSGSQAPITVQATAAALERSGLVIGDQVAVRIAGADLPVEVAGTTEDVAGMATDEVLVADLADVTRTALASGGPIPRANQIWIDAAAAGPEMASLADAVSSIAGPRADVIDRVATEAALRANAFARMSLVTYWVVTGAVVLLAGIGLAAAGAIVYRDRSAEVGMLRALGASSKLQARLGRREQLAVSVLALVLGAGAGGLVTVLVAGLLAGAATPIEVHGVEPVFHLSILPWVIVLAALAGLAVACAVGYGERLRRRAAEPPSRGFGS
ncbi:MAG TPA: FtsX-like permease family protein [Jiangellaceae bacterium]